jgi:RNA binding exosome subunit
MSFLSDLSDCTPEFRLAVCLTHIEQAISSSALYRNADPVKKILEDVFKELDTEEFAILVSALERKAIDNAKLPYSTNHQYAYDCALSLQSENDNLAHPGQIVFEPEDF